MSTLNPAFLEAFGWFWIGMGFAAGGVMGLFFHRAAWLGGYDAWARRLLRLGHIAMVGLGVLNILFAQSAPRVELDSAWVGLAGWSLLTGAVLMPGCCFLAAWRPWLRALFPAPVLALGTGVTVTWIGLLRGALQLGGVA